MLSLKRSPQANLLGEINEMGLILILIRLRTQHCQYQNLRQNTILSGLHQTNRLRVRLHWNQKQHNTQSGQTPDKELEIKNITVYVSGYNETEATLKPIRLECYLHRLSGANRVCFEPTVWSDTCCSARRISSDVAM